MKNFQSSLREVPSALRRRFSRAPVFLQLRSGGVCKLAVQSLEPCWLVGRSLCMFRSESFEHVPKAKRDAAVRNQVQIWSPFDRTGSHCVWNEARAMVWFWDESAVDECEEQVVAEGEGRAAGCRRLPETVFLPAPEGDGVVLQHCQEGCDLQRWRDGYLEESAWFPTEPPAAQVARLLERAPGTTGTTSAAASHLSEPWGDRASSIAWLLGNERRIAGGCLLVLSAIAFGQEVLYWRINALTGTVTADFQSLQEEVGPVLAARRQTQTLEAANRARARLVESPSQARLMSLLDRALPNATAEFRQWNYQQGDLRVIVEDPNMNPMTYVRALEAEPLFADVRAEQAQGRNQIELSMTIARAES